MSKLQPHFKQSNNVSLPSPPSPSHSITTNTQPTNKPSPIILLVIVVLSIVFFISGILLLLIRFLIKRPFFYTVSHSNRYSTDNPSSNALQRQLQNLFRLHDSGLDQVLIDALPVFTYKDIIGLNEPFDCAICLCEFSYHDNLRLLPMCSHAFHITCIDTWLLSNSTCPLCRSSLLTSGFENQEFSLNHWREFSLSCSIDNDHNSTTTSGNNKPTIMEESASERRVFSVRLGKFRSSSNGEGHVKEGESSSRSNDNQFDVRRCYSMGSCQYVVSDLNLQVALLNEIGYSSKDGISFVDMDVDGKKISRKNKGDSFSVSKIWLWSKKSKFSSSSQVDVFYGGTSTLSDV